MRTFSSPIRLLTALVVYTTFCCTALPRTVSAQAPEACVFVGPRLLSLDTQESTLLNAVLGNYLGSGASLTVLDWNGVAQADIFLFNFLEALRVDLSLGTPAQALGANATLLQVINAALVAAPADGPTTAALNALATSVSGLSGTIRLGDFITGNFEDGALANLQMNLLNLITGSFQLFNYENVATTPTPIVVDGNAVGLGSVFQTIQIRAQVIEPPVIGCGSVGSTYHTAAIRMHMLGTFVPDTEADTGDAGQPGILNSVVRLTQLETYTEIARGDAEIASIDAGTGEVVMNAQPGTVDLYIGTISEALFFNRAHLITYPDDVGFTPVGEMEANTAIGSETLGIEFRSSTVEPSPGAEPLLYTPPYPETQTALRFALSAMVTNIVGNTESRFTGVPGPILTPVALVLTTLVQNLQPLTNSLDNVFFEVADPAVEATGAKVGQDIVTVETANNTSLNVEFTDFRALTEDGDVLLTWSTASETNNAGFEVQVAAAQDGFEPLGFVAGHGTTADHHTYSYRAAHLSAGMPYRFRLRQVDHDGSFTFSPIVEIDLPLQAGFSLDVYPNPVAASDAYRVAFGFTDQGVQPEDDINIALYDVQGRLVQTFYAGSAGAVQRRTFQTDHLSPGLYYVRMAHAARGLEASRTLVVIN